MAREKDGYRNALVRCITTLSGGITSGCGKRIPATVLARQIC